MKTSTDIDLISQMLLPNTPRKLYDSHERELIAIRDGTKPISMFQFKSAEDRECIKFVEKARTLGLRVIVRTQTVPIDEIKQVALVYLSSSDSEFWRAEALSFVWQANATFAVSDSTSYISSRLLGYSHEDAEEWVRSRSIPLLYFMFTDKHRREITAYKGRLFRLSDPAASKVFYPLEAYAKLTTKNVRIPKSVTFGRVRVAEGAISDVFSRVSPHNNILLAPCSRARVGIIDNNMKSNIELMSDGEWRQLSKY